MSDLNYKSRPCIPIILFIFIYYNQIQFSAFTSLSSTIFWIIGMMLLTNNPRTYRMGPIRHLINWWCMFVFIMSTSFSSVLYSYMTSPEYNKLVLEVEDMVKSNYHWGLTYPPPFDFILKMQVRYINLYPLGL